MVGAVEGLVDDNVFLRFGVFTVADEFVFAATEVLEVAVGVLFQRNIGSLEGLYGEAVSVRAEALMAEGLYDTQGTDLHNERYAQFFDSFGFKVG